MNFFAGLWSAGYLFGFFNTDMSWKMIALRFELLGVIGTTFYWFLFIATYLDYDFLLKKKILAILAIIPILTIIEVILVDIHPIFYRNTYLVEADGMIVFCKDYGIGFYLHLVYSYFLVFLGTVMILNSIIQLPGNMKYQLVPFSLIILIVAIPNLFYIAGNNPLHPYDPTLVSFVAVAVVFVYIFRRHKFLNVVPVAYNMVFNNVKSGIIIIDERLTIVEMNRAAELIVGVGSQKVLGENIRDVFPKYLDLIEKYEKTKETSTEITIGARKKTYELKISPLLGKGNKIVGRIVMLYDISELRSALNYLDAYAHTVAHDLKNPLSSQKGLIDLLSSGELEHVDEKIALRTIRECSSKMFQIIDSLLLMASVRRQQDIKVSPVVMEFVVTQSLIRVKDLAKERGARIDVPSSWPSVLGYKPWIEEVWVNYLSNGIKYGGTNPRIEVGADVEENEAKFWVKDYGPGLTREEQQKLFEEFSRLAYRETSGHGLGLFIVKRIIQKLGGTTGVESEPGKGAKFYFTLPLAK